MSAFFRSHSHDLRQLSASCELAPVCVINSVTRWVVSIVPVPVPLPLRVLRCCPPPPPPPPQPPTTLALATTTDDDDEDRCFCCRQPAGGSLLRRCSGSCCCCCCRLLLPSQHPPQQQQQQHLVHPPAPEQQRVLSEATTWPDACSQHGRIFAEPLLAVVFFFFVVVVVFLLWVRVFGDAPATIRSTAQVDAAAVRSNKSCKSTPMLLRQSGAILNLFRVCFPFWQITLFSLNHSVFLQFCSRLYW